MLSCRCSSLTCVHNTLGTTVGIFALHLPTWSRGILQFVSYFTCEHSQVAHYVKLYPTNVQIDKSDIVQSFTWPVSIMTLGRWCRFYMTHVHIDTTNIVEDFISQLYVFQRVIPGQVSFYSSYTCPLLNIWCGTGPKWHLELCTNFHVTHIHNYRWGCVNIFMRHVSVWTLSTLYQFSDCTCTHLDMSCSTDFHVTDVHIFRHDLL